MLARFSRMSSGSGASAGPIDVNNTAAVTEARLSANREILAPIRLKTSKGTRAQPELPPAAWLNCVSKQGDFGPHFIGIVEIGLVQLSPPLVRAADRLAGDQPFLNRPSFPFGLGFATAAGSAVALTGDACNGATIFLPRPAAFAISERAAE